MKSEQASLVNDSAEEGASGLERFHDLLPPPHPMARRSFLVPSIFLLDKSPRF